MGKRIDITDTEQAVLKQALESFNDMQNDMMFEEMTADLFPRGDAVTTINSIQASQLRKELAAKFEHLFAIRSLLYKIGSKVNEAGYSV